MVASRFAFALTLSTRHGSILAVNRVKFEVAYFAGPDWVNACTVAQTKYV